MIKISDNIPIPKKNQSGRKGRKGDGRQEAILKLETGQSFFLKTSISSASTLKWWCKSRYPEREFATEGQGDGVRIWRTK
jgi:hypothetical protein